MTAIAWTPRAGTTGSRGAAMLGIYVAVAITATGALMSHALESSNVAVVVNEESWASIALAEAYVQLRGIPARNVIRLGGFSHFESVGVAEFRERILAPVFAEIRARGLEDTIDCIAYSSDIPYDIDFRFDIGANGVKRHAGTRASLTGLTFLYESVLKGDVDAYTALQSNRYARHSIAGKRRTAAAGADRAGAGEGAEGGKRERAGLAVQPGVPFGARTAWDAQGQPMAGKGKDAQGRRYMLATMLGVTSGRGLSVREAVSVLERAAAADGTRPAGTVYYMRNGDVRSRTREWGFEAAVRMLKELGVSAVVEEGTLPSGHSDVAGAMVGIAGFDWPGSGSRILPGAICEHLTSAGGVMTWTLFQTPLTEFLRNGAAGASGTVTEPLAIQAKFPDPFIQVYYAQGFSLAEAFYLSVRGPYQLLIVGDPLCRPWGKARVAPVACATVDAGPTLAADASLQPDTGRRGLRVVGGDGVCLVSGVDTHLAWWRSADIAPGAAVKVEGLVQAPTNDIYQFQVMSAGDARVLVDGRALRATGRGEWQMFPANLAAGPHAVCISATARGDAHAPRSGPPLELRFGAAGVRPLEEVLRCQPRKGDLIRNVGTRPVIRIDKGSGNPGDVSLRFGIEGLEGLAKGTLAMSWDAGSDSKWSIEPRQARTTVSRGASDPVAFRIRYAGALPDLSGSVPAGFFPMLRCTFRLERDLGPEHIAPYVLPADMIMAGLQPPRIIVPKAVQPPKIDGVLDDAAWAASAALPRFLRPHDRQPARQPSVTHLTWDDRAIYVAFRCSEPELDSMRLKALRRDDSLNSVNLDDSAEFFIDADADRKTYRQFIVNAAGVVYDGRGWDNSWNGKFESATGREEGAWTLELAVPWATLGVEPPQADASVRILVARNRQAVGAEELSTWPCATGGNHQPKLFAAAVLAGPKARAGSK